MDTTWRAGVGQAGATPIKVLFVKRISWWLCLIGCGLIGACVEPIVSMRPGTRTFSADDYEEIYERWTRSANEFDFGRLKTVLHATATLESREFRWAYVVRYSEDFSLPPDARSSMLAATLADADRHHRFFLTIGDGRPRELDLTDEGGAFRVLLVDDRGRQTRPTEVERVRIATKAERTYFSSISPFRQAFRLVFPVTGEDGYPTLPPEALSATLRITGPSGHVDLTWEFADQR